MKKRVNFKEVLIILMVVMMATTSCLTGCSLAGNAEATSVKDSVAIVISGHGNMRPLNLEHSELKDKVIKTVSEYGYVSVIGVDGKPDIVGKGSFDIKEQYKNASKEKLKADAEAKANSLMQLLYSIRADDPEVDTLAALDIAVKSLHEGPKESLKTIIVVDTGLCTTGLLNFGNNLLLGEPEEIANMLAEKHAIPDFTDITVTWLQMGEVDFPQEELSPRQQERLCQIWEAIIVKGGGKWNQIYGAPLKSAEEEDSLPEVTPIKLMEEMPVIIQEEYAEVSFEVPLIFNEEKVQFVGDSSVYVDQEKAMESIRPIAEYMLKNETFKLLLVGTTAGDEDNDYVRELSLERANAVKESLKSFGVEDSRIVTLGLGSSDKWHIYGVGTSGELAAQNRKVVMLDRDSVEAIEMLIEAGAL